MTTHELWQAVLGELELSLSKANFTTWFRNTFIASQAGTEVCIGVPNAFTKAWLEKKYHRDILNCLQTLTNHTVRVISYRVEARVPAPSMAVPVAAAQEPAYVAAPAQDAAAPVIHANQPQSGEFTLNGKYVFGTFIVGKQNELAHAASQAVAAQPGGVYNPLFIYGGVGLGKTHLIQAVGNEVLRKNPNARILYVTCERFTNDFINAVRQGQGREFKNHYRTVDVLLVDDIQFITGKEGTQEEFFHTFNQLHQNNKQIVISSDRPPKAIPTLEH